VQALGIGQETIQIEYDTGYHRYGHQDFAYQLIRHTNRLKLTAIIARGIRKV
jgi:hypothetical protein